MKIKFLATSKGAEYSFKGEKITIDGEEIDLSEFPESARFQGIEGDEKNVVRNIERKDGEMYVTLCQACPVSRISYKTDQGMIHRLASDPAPESYTQKIEHRGGHWTESDWIDADEYDPEKLYIKEK